MVKGLTGLELTCVEALAVLQNRFQQSQENVVAKVISAGIELTHARDRSYAMPHCCYRQRNGNR